MASIPSLPYASRFVFRRPWRAIATITPAPPRASWPLLGPALSTVARRSCMPSPAAMRPIPAEPSLKTEPRNPMKLLEPPNSREIDTQRNAQMLTGATKVQPPPVAASLAVRLPRLRSEGRPPPARPSAAWALFRQGTLQAVSTLVRFVSKAEGQNSLLMLQIHGRILEKRRNTLNGMEIKWPTFGSLFLRNQC